MTAMSIALSKAIEEYSARAAQVFPKLSMVVLTAPVTVRGHELPAGTRGTVVRTYRDTQAYEVEFPGGILTTVRPSGLAPAVRSVPLNDLVPE